jgi:hypothetical protein
LVSRIDQVLPLVLASAEPAEADPNDDEDDDAASEREVHV